MALISLQEISVAFGGPLLFDQLKPSGGAW